MSSRRLGKRTDNVVSNPPPPIVLHLLTESVVLVMISVTRFIIGMRKTMRKVVVMTMMTMVMLMMLMVVVMILMMMPMAMMTMVNLLLDGLRLLSISSGELKLNLLHGEASGNTCRLIMLIMLMMRMTSMTTRISW